MGKRKQKTRWSSIAGLEWSQDSQTTTTSTAQRSPAAAPRFERKAAAEKHLLYQEEFCEADDLANGFTKIRSKNLDILFKRDYYEQKIVVHSSSEDQGKSLEYSLADTKDEGFEEETVNESKPEKSVSSSTMSECNTTAQSSFDHINISEIQEFQPMKSCERYFDPTSHYHQEEQANLYLYSPSENTLIPCEEMMISDPALYSGHTNIYLAYPDRRDYSYSPSTEYEGSTCYSGSSTQPTSPQHPPTPPPDTPSTYYIPGLPPQSTDTKQRKGTKKRKKKKKADLSEVRVSTSSESEPAKMEILGDDITTDTFDIQELCLTDDLANSLVNPPTDTESFEDAVCDEKSKLGHDSTDAVTGGDASNNDCEDVSKCDGISNITAKDSKSRVTEVIVEKPSTESAGMEVSEDVEVREILKSEIIEASKKEANDGDMIDINSNLCQYQPVPGDDACVRKSTDKKSEKMCRTEEELEVVIPSAPQHPLVTVKKSYSSVTKSSNNISLKESKMNPTSSLPSQPDPAPERDDCEDIVEKGSDDLVVSIDPSLQETWAKTPKRRKQRKRNIKSVRIPVKEEVKVEVAVAHEQESEEAEDASEEIVVDDQEKVNGGSKKKIKKKKKSLSADPVGHRVLICDDQVEILPSQSARRASGVLTPSLLGVVNASENILVVRELGSGISRGSMNYGRLYQGKYTPPHRTDGVPLWCDEKTDVEKENIEMTGDEVAASVNIDLD